MSRFVKFGGIPSQDSVLLALRRYDAHVEKLLCTVGIRTAAGILYALFGLLLSAVIASAAMAASSVSVLTNSLRLRRFGPGVA